MANKSAKTMRGKNIDMATLIANNEKVVAVGNLNVNARGDMLGPGGLIEVTKEEITKIYYDEEAKRPNKEVAKRQRIKRGDGKLIDETTYTDGSIEVVEVDLKTKK
ncbi:uncharacterized protein METZ01_LOCUS478728 [marine metagenome]|uniref:Uncharacterized protein n=1 Tax=marine metagenome TaxID=408172 RepID=A0A383C114_9ZZZZ